MAELADTQQTARVRARDQSTAAVARRERLLLGLATLFVLVGAASLFLGYEPFRGSHLALVILPFTGTFALAHVALHRWLPRRDPFLLPVAALLSGLGLLLLGRLARNFLVRQAIWLPVSAIGLLAVVRLGKDLRWLRRYRYTWLIGGIALLGATLLLGVNPSGFGPRLWLGAGGLYLQPSELLKLLMITFLASYLAERRGLIVSEGWRVGRLRLPPLAYVGPMLVMFSLALVILAWQQDLGAAMLFFLTFIGMLYLATGQWGYPAVGLLLIVALGVAGYAYSDLVRLRIDAWWSPWPEASGRAFQVVQSLLAYGAGGVLGEGLGLGSPGLIPAVHTDFVHAAVAEELGLLGALAVIALFAVLMSRGLRTASRVRTSFEQLLAAGITIGLSVQAWVIMAGNAKVAPITGVTLPFVSYGGSSLFATFLGLGLLLRVSAGVGKANNVIAPSLQPQDLAATQGRIRKLATVLSLAFLILAGACGYWAVVRSEYLLSRDDNIREIFRDQRIVRGDILDRDGTSLATVNLAEDGTVSRQYPSPDSAPALGYYSYRYGATGIEGALDDILRGEEGRTPLQLWWDDLIHTRPQGRDVQLTLDSELQEAAQTYLEGVQGAAVLLDAHTGEVLVLASSPSYNPNHLDDQWAELTEAPESPLLNRATQGRLQPGSLMHTVVLAEALASGDADLGSVPSDPLRSYSVDGAEVACDPAEGEPETLAEAYARGCPGPVIDLAHGLGPDGFSQAVRRWSLDLAPRIEIPAESSPWEFPDGDIDAIISAEALGQGSLVFSPLRAALMTAALGAEGEVPGPYLVQRVQDPDGDWVVVAPPELERGTPVVDELVSEQLLNTWDIQDQGRIRSRTSSAVAGEGKLPHVWYSGLTTVAGKVYAVVVLVEHAADAGLPEAAGLALLRAALEQ